MIGLRKRCNIWWAVPHGKEGRGRGGGGDRGPEDSLVTVKIEMVLRDLE